MLINKIDVIIIDDESGNHVLTIEKLINGVKLNTEHRPFDSSIENGDAITMECIIQYALFGDVIYG